MTPVLRVTVLGLSLSLLCFLSLAPMSQVSAYPDPIYCTDLASCQGNGVCPNGGIVNGCDIECFGGGSVNCPPIED